MKWTGSDCRGRLVSDTTFCDSNILTLCQSLLAAATVLYSFQPPAASTCPVQRCMIQSAAADSICGGCSLPGSMPPLSLLNSDSVIANKRKKHSKTFEGSFFINFGCKSVNRNWLKITDRKEIAEVKKSLNSLKVNFIRKHERVNRFWSM